MHDAYAVLSVAQDGKGGLDTLAIQSSEIASFSLFEAVFED
jgi:hypothetical protein